MDSSPSLFTGSPVVYHGGNVFEKTMTERITNEVFGAPKTSAAIDSCAELVDERANDVDGRGPVCPLCGVSCQHTVEEMNGFALDALEQTGVMYQEGAL